MYRHSPTCLEGPWSVDRPCWHEQPDGPPTEFRPELVARIRREIAAGTYDTPEKLEIALERLFAHLPPASGAC